MQKEIDIWCRVLAASRQCGKHMTSLMFCDVTCFMHPAFCISILSQHKLKFILSDNHANISRNKEARGKVLDLWITLRNCYVNLHALRLANLCGN